MTVRGGIRHSLIDHPRPRMGFQLLEHSNHARAISTIELPDCWYEALKSLDELIVRHRSMRFCLIQRS